MEKNKIIQPTTTQGQFGETEGSEILGTATLMPPGFALTADPIQRKPKESAIGPGDSDGDEAEPLNRMDESRRRVDMDRNPDNPVYNRWQSGGADSHYTQEFDEAFKVQSKQFFGEDLSHVQIEERIAAAKTAGNEAEAEALRKKLFRANQYAIVETLNSPENPIYQKTGGDTFCNIYAYDVVTALGGYLPRLWWTDAMEAKIESGETQEADVAVKYDGGVTHEMRANMLNDWMNDHGSEFGWVKAASMEAAQTAANDGNIVIILASNKVADKPGHVNVILAETEQHQSESVEDGSFLPLQSQAGGVNFKYDTYASNPKWWENKSHENGAAWICLGKPNSPILTPEQVGLAPNLARNLATDAEGLGAQKAVAEKGAEVVANDESKANEVSGKAPIEQSGGYSTENAILSELNTTGAGKSVTEQDGKHFTDYGVTASERMAKKDMALINQYAQIFVEVGQSKGLPPALLAAICSRESRGGSALDATGHGDHGHGYGLMQIDDRSHNAKGAWNSKEHVAQAADILKTSLEKVTAKFPDWTPAQQLRGAVASYNFGVKNLQTLGGMDGGTTGDDYSADTWARARYYAGLKEFGGEGQIPNVELPTQKTEGPTKGPTKRPSVPNGRLIAQSVGKGGVNHEDDVNAVLDRMEQLGVITNLEAMNHEAGAVAQYVVRYQSMTSDQPANGIIHPGKGTESNLMQGVKTKQPKASGNPKGDQGNPNSPKGAPKPPKGGTEKGGKEPRAKGTEPDYTSIARRVYHAMFGGFAWGLGTSETEVKVALSELHRKADYIAGFKQVYTQLFGSDVVEDIKGEHSNTLLWGDELDEALKYLEPRGGHAEKTKEKVATKTTGNPSVDPKGGFVSKDAWRTQSSAPTPENKKYQDSEPGDINCKYVAEKMVYRHLYPDLDPDFKRNMVINAPVGTYDYVVGATGNHEYLSVQREDKSQVKDIIPKKHKASVFKESESASVAIDYLSGYLSQGIPVVVGVDHTYNRSLEKTEGSTSSKNTDGYNEGTTDHFVTIVGQGMADGKRYFQFFDPGTQHLGSGTGENNKLVEQSPNVFTAKQPWSSKTYTLTMVILFRRDLKTYEDYVKDNATTFNQLEEDFNEGKGDFSYRK